MYRSPIDEQQHFSSQYAYSRKVMPYLLFTRVPKYFADHCTNQQEKA